MATWEVLKNQIVEGLQMSSSGIPYWTLDIGAFFTGNRKAWMRGLFFDYPDDQKARGISDKYLFGDFLVCPVEYGPSNALVNGIISW